MAQGSEHGMVVCWKTSQYAVTGITSERKKVNVLDIECSEKEKVYQKNFILLAVSAVVDAPIPVLPILQDL